jgi:hypothetical protein
LDSEQRNLGLVFLDEISKWHVEAVICTDRATCFDRPLHFLFHFSEPILNVSFSNNTVNKWKIFFSASKRLVDRFNYISIVLVKTDAVNGIKKLLEIILHCIWIRSI